jgi:hypothetical protein
VSSSVDFEEVFSKSPDFNDMFQQGAKNIEGSLFKISFHIWCMVKVG